MIYISYAFNLIFIKAERHLIAPIMYGIHYFVHILLVIWPLGSVVTDQLVLGSIPGYAVGFFFI